MIAVHSSHNNLLQLHVTTMKGGHQLYVSLQQELVDTIKWVQQHKSQLERERQIRAQDPAAQELFTQYETYLNLTYNK